MRFNYVESARPNLHPRWKKILPVAAVITVVIAAGVMTVATGMLTSKIEIMNNMPYVLQVSGCGDTASIPAGGSADLEINNYEAVDCQLYQNDVSRPLGCLKSSKVMAKMDAKYSVSSIIANSISPSCIVP